MKLNNNKGSSIAIIVLSTALIVFVLFPVFAAIIERYIIADKVEIIKDAIDIANISTYMAIDKNNMGKDTITLQDETVNSIYRSMLAKNLNLDNNLNPNSSSVSDGAVIIKSLEIYTSGFPLTCPDGTIITRPSVHAYITVPLKPSLYRQIILQILGKQYVELIIHLDTEIPVNN